MTRLRLNQIVFGILALVLALIIPLSTFVIPWKPQVAGLLLTSNAEKIITGIVIVFLFIIAVELFFLGVLSFFITKEKIVKPVLALIWICFMSVAVVGIVVSIYKAIASGWVYIEFEQYIRLYTIILSSTVATAGLAVQVLFLRINND
jgi:hypothetical protein